MVRRKLGIICLGGAAAACCWHGASGSPRLQQEAFGSQRLLARIENLTALTLRLNPETCKTPGVYHAVLKKLAWDKISVMHMMCTFFELTILLEQSQAGAAFSVLSRIVGH